MMVKICGITKRQDAVAAAEAGASALGFIFYPKSPRYVTPETARELGTGLSVLKVGVFVEESEAAIEEAAHRGALDVAQIYGSASLAEIEVWRAFRVAADWRAGDLPHSGTLFLDGSANGVAFDWKLARGLSEKFKLILAGGLNASNVAEAIRIARPWGVDASSALEVSPGIKDHEKVRQFIKAAREAAA